MLIMINKTFADLNSAFCFQLTVCHQWANWTTFHSPCLFYLLLPQYLLPLSYWSRWNSLNCYSSLKFRSSVFPNILLGPHRYTLCTHTYFEVSYCEDDFLVLLCSVQSMSQLAPWEPFPKRQVLDKCLLCEGKNKPQDDGCDFHICFSFLGYDLSLVSHQSTHPWEATT